MLHKHDCNKIQSQYLMNKELITLHARIERKRLALKMLEAQIEARRDDIHIIGERIGFIESALQSGTSTAKEAKQ